MPSPRVKGLSLDTSENSQRVTKKIRPQPKGLSSDTIEEFSIVPNAKDDIILNKTYTHIIESFSFGNLSQQVLIKFYKDGRHFAPVIELYLQEMFPLIHKEGCASYDFTDDSNNKYDEKTFTKGGCNFMPSSMIGTGRKFDKVKFNEKANKLIYIIVSNINFPEIKIKFVRGIDLIIDYPNGKIPPGNFYDFFS
jgi:hypothetical protein